jgi:hypothetical protein
MCTSKSCLAAAVRACACALCVGLLMTYVACARECATRACAAVLPWGGVRWIWGL